MFSSLLFTHISNLKYKIIASRLFYILTLEMSLVIKMTRIASDFDNSLISKKGEEKLLCNFSSPFLEMSLALKVRLLCNLTFKAH